MRCRLCEMPAGWFRRRCALCERLWQVYQANRGAPLQEMLKLFVQAGARREAMQRFLRADPDGGGAVQDRIAADMANQLLEAFGGSAGQQRTEDAKRLRDRGAWKSFGEPPE